MLGKAQGIRGDSGPESGAWEEPQLDSPVRDDPGKGIGQVQEGPLVLPGPIGIAVEEAQVSPGRKSWSEKGRSRIRGKQLEWHRKGCSIRKSQASPSPAISHSRVGDGGVRGQIEQLCQPLGKRTPEESGAGHHSSVQREFPGPFPGGPRHPLLGQSCYKKGRRIFIVGAPEEVLEIDNAVIRGRTVQGS